jgi:hypothetical protein
VEKETIKVSLELLEKVTSYGLDAITWSYNEHWSLAEQMLGKMNEWIDTLEKVGNIELEYSREHIRAALKGVKEQHANIVDGNVSSAILRAIEALREAIQ